MRSNLIAGLDIGSTKTCVVIGEFMDDFRRPELKVLGVGQAPTAGMRKDMVTNLEEATGSIRRATQEAELMSGANIDRVYVGISGEHIHAQRSVGVVAVAAEEIVGGDVDRVHEVARAVALPPDRQMLHAIPQDYVVDHQGGIKDPIGMIGTRLETDLYLVTGCNSSVENVGRAVEKAGYRVQDMILEPLASARAVLTEDEKELGVAMVELGGATTGLSVFYEGKIRHLAVLPFGSCTITSDLIRGLSVPFAEAKRIKELHGVACARMVDPYETIEIPGLAPGQKRTVARQYLAQMIEERCEEMFGQIYQRLTELHHGMTLGAGIVLTGGGATLPGLVELAQSCFSAPVRVGVPWEGLSGLSDAVARPRFATAAGLALHGADHFLETGEGASTVASGVVTKVGAWLKEFF
ncbi:MAG: cell division protein FtsA [Longimicrobiales bacterium]